MGRCYYTLNKRFGRFHDVRFGEVIHGIPGKGGAMKTVEVIAAAVRPAVSFAETHFIEFQSTSNSKRDLADDIDLDEAVGKWMVSVRPRERNPA